MNIFGKPLGEITGDDLKDIVANKERENRSLDFKSEAYKPTPGDKKEFCKDISALANASGGYLILVA